MITIIYSTHKDELYNSNFKEHLYKSVGLDNVEVLEFINHNEFSLSEIYNKGIKISKYEIIVCCHNDIKLEKDWGKKLLLDFERNPDYGIIGKAGSCYFPKSGVYWEKMNQTMVGQVYHHPENSKKWLNKYSPKLPFLIPVVTIDGLFISFNKNKIKHSFDESIGKFHFYDHPFCLSNYLDGVKLGVTSSFEITHQSIGAPNQEFFQSKEIFLQKFGSLLPLDLKPENIFTPNITKIKTKDKVSIIIPHKNNFEILKNCINSFYTYSDSNLFHIFIADTGSDENEKVEIKNLILNYNNITMIEYDYYNFAKINNDVVKNHISKDFDFILFSNNDIEIKNDVISGLLSTFKKNPFVGTVGCRLHYPDNTIQHDGILIYLNGKNKTVMTVNKNINNYFNYTLGVNESLGSTGALFMVRKNVFINNGMFNENYKHCWEDAEFNCNLILKGFKNYINSECVAIHYESKTRNISNTMDEMMSDYNNIFLKFLFSNFDKLKQHIFVIQ
jgi:GT2 family glycosyltransferase